MKFGIWQFLFGFLVAVVMFLAGCGGGGAAGEGSGMNAGISSPAEARTCINDYYKKESAQTGFAVCFDDVDAEFCNAAASADNEFDVNVMMIEKGCEAVGFSKDSLKEIAGRNAYTMMSRFTDKTHENIKVLFPTIDESAYVNNPPEQVIKTTSKRAQFKTKPAESAVVVDANNRKSGSFESGRFVLTEDAGISAGDIGKALFIDGDFEGMITEVTRNGSEIEVDVSKADSLEQMYSSFDLEVQNDALLKAVQRSLQTHSIGKYDAINKEPLKVTAYKKSVKSRGVEQEEIVLRVDIPKGYIVPVKPRALDCSFWDASCDFTASGKVKGKLGLDVVWPEGQMTFDSSGSYIEIGLGSYLKVHYDHNTFSDDVFQVTGAQSAYFKANVSVKFSGNLLGGESLENKTYWEKNLDLVKGLDIEIIQPYSEFVKTSIMVDPVLTMGAAIALNGTASYQTTITRTGEIRFTYDSTTGESSFNSDVSDKGNNLTKDTIKVGMEASGSVYLFPNLTMIPSIKFVRTTMLGFTIVSLRSGIKLDTTALGRIEEGFTLLNDGKIVESSGTSTGVSTTLYGLIQGKWIIQAGSRIFYTNESYIDIGSKLGNWSIFEWKAPLLKKPKVIVKEKDGKKQIVFDSDDDDKIKEHLYFYYTIAPKNESKYDIAVTGIENHRPVWRIGDKPIKVDENGVVKVRAVLYNKDVSTSIWAFGTSVSQQEVKEIVNMMTPEISPASQSFEDTLTVTLTQSQGYDIYYSIDNGSIKRYSGPFTIDQTATVTAYAKAEVNGKTVLSDEVSASYTKCDADEVLEDGVCVLNSSSSSSSDSDVKACPKTNPDPDSFPGWYHIYGEGGTHFLWCSYYGNNQLLESSWYEGSYFSEMGGNVLDGKDIRFKENGDIEWCDIYRHGERTGYCN